MTVKFNQALLLEEKRPPVLLEARHLYKKIIEISPQYVDAYARIARQDFKRGPADTALAGRAKLLDNFERILDACNEGEKFRNADPCRMARHTSAVTLSDSVISCHGLNCILAKFRDFFSFLSLPF